jgi:hypothetical protein
MSPEVYQLDGHPGGVSANLLYGFGHINRQNLISFPSPWA